MTAFFALSCISAYAQANEWTWMGGSNTKGQSGVYGTPGAPARGNIPGARDSGSTWTDSSDHLWLFGGVGNDADGNGGMLNDLWRFDTSANEWAWMSGSKSVGPAGNVNGVYGTEGVFAARNVPGSRESFLTWTDSSGHLWLFGGWSNWTDSNNNSDYNPLNDLWEFDPSTKEWAWMGGSTTAQCGRGCPAGVYGTLGQPSSSNIPEARYGHIGWTDSNGNFWLFGGNGGYLNDLWEFSPSTGEWAWVAGNNPNVNNADPSGVYGTLGTPDAGNIPGGRYSAATWTDSVGHLWLFGGFGFDSAGNRGYLNDLWEFIPSTLEWAWMGGSNTVGSECVPLSGTSVTLCGSSGAYGTEGIPADGNLPGSRNIASSWTDGSGNLWLFGGEGYDAYGSFASLNDLWEFNTSTKQWTWMGGGKRAWAQPAVYGALGVPAPGNIPGSRKNAMAWSDRNGYFWIFGGSANDSKGQWGEMNDVWRYEPPDTALPTAKPAIKPASGTYPSAQSVTITDATSGAAIYYTTDGSTPSPTNGTKYASAISVKATETINAVATAANYNSSPVATATYTLRLPQTIAFTQPTSPVTYGAKPITLSATSNSGLPVALTIVSGPATLSTNTLTITGAGSVVVAANQPGNATYAAASQVTRTITVNKAALTAAAAKQSMTYGGLLPPLTYTLTGFVNGDTQATATTGAPAVSTTAKATSPVGSYPITIATGTLAAANYSFQFTNSTLTVTKAALTVTANNLSMKQGAAVPTLTYAIAGFQNGDTQAKATTGAPKLTTTATSKSVPGTYPITAAAGTLAATNYTFTFVNGTLTVTN